MGLTQISDNFPQFIIVKKAGITARSLSYYRHDYAMFNQKNFVSDLNATRFEYLSDSTLEANDKFNSKYAPLKKTHKEGYQV